MLLQLNNFTVIKQVGHGTLGELAGIIVFCDAFRRDSLRWSASPAMRSHFCQVTLQNLV